MLPRNILKTKTLFILQQTKNVNEGIIGFNDKKIIEIDMNNVRKRLAGYVEQNSVLSQLSYIGFTAILIALIGMMVQALWRSVTLNRISQGFQA